MLQTTACCRVLPLPLVTDAGGLSGSPSPTIQDIINPITLPIHNSNRLLTNTTLLHNKDPRLLTQLCPNNKFNLPLCELSMSHRRDAGVLTILRFCDFVVQTAGGNMRLFSRAEAGEADQYLVGDSFSATQYRHNTGIFVEP